MIQVLKHDCSLVTLKIIPLMASKIALFYDTSLLIQHILILFIRFIHVVNEG